MGFPDPRPRRTETPRAVVRAPRTKFGTPDIDAMYTEILDGKATALKLNAEINEKLEEIQLALGEVLKRLPKEPLHDVETTNP